MSEKVAQAIAKREADRAKAQKPKPAAKPKADKPTEPESGPA